MIELRGVSKTVMSGTAPLTILHPLDLDVSAGRFLAVTGPSGSGKSTLLGLIAGLDSPSSGRIAIDGTDITSLDEDRLARLRGQKIGFVFQFFHLVPSLTAFENVMVPMEIAGRSDAAARASLLLSEVGLTGRGHHYPSQLSGGEQQRIAIARAFAERSADPARRRADREPRLGERAPHHRPAAGRQRAPGHDARARDARREPGGDGARAAGAQGRAAGTGLMRFVIRMAVRELRASWRRLLLFFVCIALGVGGIVLLRSVVQDVRAAIARDARSMVAADVTLSTSRPWDEKTRQRRGAAAGRRPGAGAHGGGRDQHDGPPGRRAPVRHQDGGGAGRSAGVSAVRDRGAPGRAALRACAAGGPRRARPPRTAGSARVASRRRHPDRDRPLHGAWRHRVGARAARVGASASPRGSSSTPPISRPPACWGSAAGSARDIQLRLPERAIEPVVTQLRADLRGQFVNVRSFRGTEDRVGEDLSRAENYLSLVGLVIVILGGIGVSSVTRVFVRQKVRSVAILKCLGATSRQVFAAYLAQAILLGGAGCVLGVALAAAGLAALPLAVRRPAGGGERAERHDAVRGPAGRRHRDAGGGAVLGRAAARRAAGEAVAAAPGVGARRRARLGRLGRPWPACWPRSSPSPAGRPGRFGSASRCRRGSRRSRWCCRWSARRSSGRSARWRRRVRWRCATPCCG